MPPQRHSERTRPPPQAFPPGYDDHVGWAPRSRQGYLLRYKRDPEAAVRNVREELAADAAERYKEAQRRLAELMASPTSVAADLTASKARQGLTALDVDKLMFNPQEDWEAQVGVGEIRRPGGR